MSKTLKMVLGVGLVVVLLGGVGIWYFALRSENKETSVDAINSANTPSNSARASADGKWKLKQDPDAFVGYHIQEVFAPGVAKVGAEGFTPAVEGSMTIAGTSISEVQIKADMTKLKSDKAMRDSAIQKRGIETATFTESTFKLTSPITLAAAPQKDQEVDATAKGDLTLHGVTKAVEIPLKAKWKGEAITVTSVGDGFPIVLADYKIAPVEIENFVKVDLEGTLKIQLLFVPA
jgi:polyisoprenoid-binding protein YceI